MVKFKRITTRPGFEAYFEIYPEWIEGYEFESYMAGNGNAEFTAEIYKTADGVKTRWHDTESLIKIQE